MKRWRRSLGLVLRTYDQRRGSMGVFILKLYLFFTALNAACYWLGLLVAYPEKMWEADRGHYFWLQVPVGLLGAIFDTASFFATVWLIRRALKSKSALEYCSHLSLDLVIAVIATFWVVFVFTASGWIMSYIEAAPETLVERSATYKLRLASAVRHPTHNLRNLYFGLVMGISAALPTLLHLGLFFRALVRRRVLRSDPRLGLL